MGRLACFRCRCVTGPVLPRRPSGSRGRNSRNRLRCGISASVRGQSRLVWRKNQTCAGAQDVALTIGRGECLGVVGESGSGNSTLGRAILQMLPYRGGWFWMVSIWRASGAGAKLRAARRRIQVGFRTRGEL